MNVSDLAADAMRTETLPGALSRRRLQLSRLRPANDCLNDARQSSIILQLAQHIRPLHFTRRLFRLTRPHSLRRAWNQVGKQRVD